MDRMPRCAVHSLLLAFLCRLRATAKKLNQSLGSFRLVSMTNNLERKKTPIKEYSNNDALIRDSDWDGTGTSTCDHQMQQDNDSKPFFWGRDRIGHHWLQTGQGVADKMHGMHACWQSRSFSHTCARRGGSSAVIREGTTGRSGSPFLGGILR